MHMGSLGKSGLRRPRYYILKSDGQIGKFLAADEWVQSGIRVRLPGMVKHEMGIIIAVGRSSFELSLPRSLRSWAPSSSRLGAPPGMRALRPASGRAQSMYRPEPFVPATHPGRCQRPPAPPPARTLTARL